MLNIDKYKQNIIDGMNFIINRNVDITDEMLETEEGCWLAESVDIEYFNKFKKRYVVKIKDMIYDIDGTISKETASFIYNNVNNIIYLFCPQDDWDSELGDISYILYKYSINKLQYKRVIIHLLHIDKEQILNKLKELNIND